MNSMVMGIYNELDLIGMEMDRYYYDFNGIIIPITMFYGGYTVTIRQPYLMALSTHLGRIIPPIVFSMSTWKPRTYIFSVIHRNGS